MGDHKRNLNSQLVSKGKLDKPSIAMTPLKASICVNKDNASVVIIYNQTVDNAQYTLPQLANHLGALVGAARLLDKTFMEKEIIL